MTSPLRVLIAEDSPLFASAISSIIDEDSSFRVVGIARDGLEAVELAARLRPDVITMDVHMPVLNGLVAIERIMSSNPTPILVLTGDPRLDSGNLSFEALRRGALEALAKPAQWFMPEHEREAFRSHLRLLSGVPVVRHMQWRKTHQGLPAVRAARPPALRPVATPAPLPSACQVIGIVASTGGPGALADIISLLPADFAVPIVIVQHLSEGFAHSLVSWLAGISPLRVRLVRDHDRLATGTIFVAPDSKHVVLERGGVLRLDDGASVSGHKPSGTVMLSSMARAYGRYAAGLILTGMGDDGVAGLREMRDRGAATLAQDEESSVVFGMPREALKHGAAQRALSLLEIPAALMALAGRGPMTARPAHG